MAKAVASCPVWRLKGRRSVHRSPRLTFVLRYLWYVHLTVTQKSIYIKVTICTYVPMSLFHAQTAKPISTKFCSDLPTNSGKVLNTSMTPLTLPLDPRLPQTPKPKWVTGEKTLCNGKCSDGYPHTI